MENNKIPQTKEEILEDLEIEQAFRQVTGQPEAPLEATQVFPIVDESMIPDILPQEDFFPEEAPVPQKPSFLDTALAFYEKNKQPVLIGTCVLALVLILSVIGALVFSGSGNDPYDGKILRNVTIADVNVGGMTRSEAIDAVKAVTDDTFTKEDMVIELKDITLRLTPKDTKAKLDVKAAVNAAYDYGRTGTKQEQEAAYEASLTGNHTIGLLPYLRLEDDYILGILNDYADSIGSVMTQPSYELEGKMPSLSTEDFDENEPCQTLVITMGTPGIGFDVEHLFEQILDAYSLNEFLVEMKEVQLDATPDEPDLEKIANEICVAPVNATVDMQKYEPVPGTYGYGFDMAEAQKLVDKAEYGETVRIRMEYIEPEILDSDVFFRDTLGSCETKHTNNENRNTNLRLACAALNGLVLNPGEDFSFNQTLGKRTAEKGYKPAPAFSGDKLVDSIGGGICQISTTLYNAVLLSDLEITERHCHGMTVSYVPLGLDATVSWNGPDFKFRNNSNFPIEIEAEVSGGYVKIQILGTDEKDYYVKMEAETVSINEPKTVYENHSADSGYKDGQVLDHGTTGYYAKSYKLKYDKETGELLSRDFEAHSRYITKDKIVVKIIQEETTPPTTEETVPPTTETQPTEPAPSETTKPTEPAPSETTKPTEPAPSETTKPTEPAPPETTTPPETKAPDPTPTESQAPAPSASADDGEGATE